MSVANCVLRRRNVTTLLRCDLGGSGKHSCLTPRLAWLAATRKEWEKPTRCITELMLRNLTHAKTVVGLTIISVFHFRVCGRIEIGARDVACATLRAALANRLEKPAAVALRC